VYLIQNRVDLGGSDDRGGADQVLRIGDDQRVLAGVLDVEVEVVDDRGAFFVGLESTFAETLARKTLSLSSTHFIFGQYFKQEQAFA
jgi:hypothetical protein